MLIVTYVLSSEILPTRMATFLNENRVWDGGGRRKQMTQLRLNDILYDMPPSNSVPPFLQVCLMAAPLPPRCHPPPEFHHWRSGWSSSVWARRDSQTLSPGCPVASDRLQSSLHKLWFIFCFVSRDIVFTAQYLCPTCCHLIGCFIYRLHQAPE